MQHHRIPAVTGHQRRSDSAAARFDCRLLRYRNRAVCGGDLFGMPPKIMLPLNLAEVAYRLQITTDVQFEAAGRIAEEHHIQNIGMTIDSVTMWERFVEYNTDRGFTEGSLGAVPLRHYETITLRKLQQVAEAEKQSLPLRRQGADAGKPCPLRPASLCSDIGTTFLPTTSSHGTMCFITMSSSQGVSLPMTSTPILRSARRSSTRVSDVSWAGCSVCRRTREWPCAVKSSQKRYSQR